MLPQYSQSNWRQAPHGGVGAAGPATTAMAENLRTPSDKAFHNATRSAQTVRPRVAFSTLHPVKTRPSAAASAAPTLKPDSPATA